MKQIPYGEANRFSFSQEISRISSTPPVPILSQIDSVHAYNINSSDE
jgi:hypothetical protein